MVVGGLGGLVGAREEGEGFVEAEPDMGGEGGRVVLSGLWFGTLVVK